MEIWKWASITWRSSDTPVGKHGQVFLGQLWKLASKLWMLHWVFPGGGGSGDVLSDTEWCLADFSGCGECVAPGNLPLILYIPISFLRIFIIPCCLNSKNEFCYLQQIDPFHTSYNIYYNVNILHVYLSLPLVLSSGSRLGWLFSIPAIYRHRKPWSSILGQKSWLVHYCISRIVSDTGRRCIFSERRNGRGPKAIFN